MIKGYFKKIGFTLIELLLVIAIIGLLTSIVLFFFGPSRKKAKDARRQTDIRNIMTAMEMCYDDDNKYPVITIDGNNKVTNTSLASSLKTYLVSFPKSPGNESYYGEDNDSNRQQYCIYAILESISPTTYFCASEKGTRSSTIVPILGDCCY